MSQIYKRPFLLKMLFERYHCESSSKIAFVAVFIIYTPNATKPPLYFLGSCIEPWHMNYCHEPPRIVLSWKFRITLWKPPRFACRIRSIFFQGTFRTVKLNTCTLGRFVVHQLSWAFAFFHEGRIFTRYALHVRQGLDDSTIDAEAPNCIVKQEW